MKVTVNEISGVGSGVGAGVGSGSGVGFGASGSVYPDNEELLPPPQPAPASETTKRKSITNSVLINFLFVIRIFSFQFFNYLEIVKSMRCRIN